MRKLTLLLFAIIAYLNANAQEKESILNDLPKTTLAVISKATKFGHKEYYMGIWYRVMYTVETTGDVIWYCEFTNEHDYPITFKFCAGDEGAYKDKHNWSDDISLKAKETANKNLTGFTPRSRQYQPSSAIYMTLGALKKQDARFYDYGRPDLITLLDRKILCPYCAVVGSDDYQCPQGEIDMDRVKVDHLASIGDEYTDEELEKIKNPPAKNAAKERDKREDLAYTAVATSTVGLMGAITDSYSSKGFVTKFFVGLGYESSPMLSNSASNSSMPNKSYIETRSLFTFHSGFTLGFFNNTPVCIYLKPQVNIGISAYLPGVNGGFVSYGGTGVVQLAAKKHSKFNVFAEGGWLSYSGTFNYDGNVANNVTTNDMREGKINYTVIRYGGGFMLRWIYDGKETYLRPAVFYERPSFFTTAVQPVLSMNLQINIDSSIIFDFTYTPKTYVPGELLYPAALERKNVNYFGIKIIRQGRLH